MRPTTDHRQTGAPGAFSVAVSVSWRAAARRLVAPVACAALAAGLAGCGGSTPSGDQTGEAEPATATTSTASSATGAETGHSTPLADTSGGASTAATEAATEAAATETVRQTVTDALNKLAAGTPKPATAQVSDALTGAGIAPGVLQVSQSRTPTGLEADAIEAAVLQGRDCVIGQVRDGAVAVTVLPVLDSGKCFVGS